MKSLKLGVLGISAHFLKRVLLPLKQSQQVEIYAVSSRSEEKAKKTAEKYNIPRYYLSYGDLLNDSEIDLVYIPLPNNLHAEWIKKCADSGKHVICEKPIAMHAGEAIESINYAKSKNVYVMEAFMYKFHPQWRHVFDLVHFGEIGSVNFIHTTFGFDNTDPSDIRNIKKMGGGALMDIGCYAISVPRFLLNKEPVRVISLMNVDDAFQTDVLSSAILDFGYTRATFNISTKTFPYQKVEINGTGGLIIVQIPFNTFSDVPAVITVINGVGTREISFDPVDHYRLEFEHFVTALWENKLSSASVDDAVKNMKVIDAVERSYRSGTWETI